MLYQNLKPEEKIKFKEICDKKFGPCKNVFAESGEPLYFTNEMLLIDTTEILLSLTYNKN